MGSAVGLWERVRLHQGCGPWLVYHGWAYTHEYVGSKAGHSGSASEEDTVLERDEGVRGVGVHMVKTHYM